jgi:hypothetical protein
MLEKGSQAEHRSAAKFMRGRLEFREACVAGIYSREPGMRRP